jgi:hypothetical protein
MSDHLNKDVEEAQERFQRAMEWESSTRQLFVQDLKFANGDPDNGFQWPDKIKKDRDSNDRPALTVNKVRQHNLNIINDAKQNKPAIKFLPMAGEASYKSAQVLNALMRRIEAQSKASVAYDTATAFQVMGGIGYIRVETDYCDDEGFDQDIFIRRVENPLMVLLDPDAKELDRSDARFGFVFEDVAKEVFVRKYPKYKTNGPPVGVFGRHDWVSSDIVRVCEYYRIVETEDEMALYVDEESGEEMIATAKQIGSKAIIRALKKEGSPTRKVTYKQLEWMLIVGDEIAEGPLQLPGKYIPIVPVIGEETIIDGRLDRKGHTRAMKDPQRMYNYWSSSAVEFGALQTKTPWIVDPGSIQGYEEYWNQANVQNVGYLPARSVNEEGQPYQPPRRVEPPVAAPVSLTGMQIAQQEMEIVSGQHQAQMGMPGNERTGKAINERQRQGDRATYHYIDNLAVALRHVGTIVLDLVPTIYDTERLLMALGEDGVPQPVRVDGRAPQALQEPAEAPGPDPMEVIFNPKLGKYQVMVDVGPAYATRRDEAFEAFTLMLTQSPNLTNVVGDLMFRAADFPMADEAAERLKRMVPPMALGKGPSPTEQQLQMQVQNLTQLVQELVGQVAKGEIKQKGQEEKHDIAAYEATTKRLALVKEMIAENPQLVQDLLTEAHQIQLAPLTTAGGDDAHTNADAVMPMGQPTSIPGMRRDPTGNWQVREPGGTYAPVGRIFGEGAGVPAAPGQGELSL